MKLKVKAVAYARVSTLLGQDVENQLHGIREISKNRDFDLVAEYIDQGISGRSERRPSLDKLIRDGQKGLYSIIIIHSIDRLGRSTKHLLNLIDELKHYNISIISIRENLDFTTPMGQMALTMLSAVAQLEAQLTSERIKTALAVKKVLAEKSANGWKCGRPNLSHDLVKQVESLKRQGLSTRLIAKEIGNISKSSVSRIVVNMSQKGSQEI